MRFLSSLAVIILTFAALYIVTHAPAADSRPMFAPEYVELLRKQADARREFYSGQAREKADLKRAHDAARQELLTRHREERTKFSSEKRTAEERAPFFQAQRDEMRALRIRLKAEKKALSAEQKQKLADFHRQEKQDRELLRQKLVRKD